MAPATAPTLSAGEEALLEVQYQENPNPTSTVYWEIAGFLDLSTAQVESWFRQRRDSLNSSNLPAATPIIPPAPPPASALFSGNAIAPPIAPSTISGPFAACPDSPTSTSSTLTSVRSTPDPPSRPATPIQSAPSIISDLTSLHTTPSPPSRSATPHAATPQPLSGAEVTRSLFPRMIQYTREHLAPYDPVSERRLGCVRCNKWRHPCNMEAPCDHCIRAGPAAVERCRYTYKGPGSNAGRPPRPQQQQPIQEPGVLQEDMTPRQTRSGRTYGTQTPTVPAPAAAPRRPSAGLRPAAPPPPSPPSRSPTPTPSTAADDLDASMSEMDLDADADASTNPDTSSDYPSGPSTPPSPTHSLSLLTDEDGDSEMADENGNENGGGEDDEGEEDDENEDVDVDVDDAASDTTIREVLFDSVEVDVDEEADEDAASDNGLVSLSPHPIDGLIEDFVGGFGGEYEGFGGY